jgi:tetratricopeptide (TPR) repeat protein
MPVIASKRLTRFALAPGLALALWGCAGPKTAERSSEAAAPEVSAPPETTHTVGTRAERLFDDANALQAEERKQQTVNYEKIEDLYRQSAQASPSFAEPMYNLGLLYQRQGKLDLAATAYAEAVRRKPSLAAAIANLAGIEIWQGKAAAAQAMLEEATRKYPRDASLRARLADAYLALDDLPAAKFAAKEALMRDAKSAEAYRVLMEVAQRQQDDEMLRLLALRAQKANPDDPATPYQLGRMYLRHQEIERAGTEFRAALALDPAHEPSLTALSSLALAQGDYPAAETYLRRVLQSDPGACGAHLDLGVCEKALGHPDQALVEYQEAVRCDPKLFMAHYDRGILYHRVKSDCATAIEEYRKFITEGSRPLPGDHPVFPALQECQQLQALAEQRKATEVSKEAAESTKVTAPPPPPVAPGEVPKPGPSAKGPPEAPPDPNEPKN